jgi:hypothetical protein
MPRRYSRFTPFFAQQDFRLHGIDSQLASNGLGGGATVASHHDDAYPLLMHHPERLHRLIP